MDKTDLTPELILHAYAHGIFPMADPYHDGRITWYSPDPRAILPVGQAHIPRTLRRLVRQDRFDVTIDTCFETVIRACAEPRPSHPTTWISEEIIDNYVYLHKLGYAHSVETRYEGQVVGGLYGVKIGGAFFGESMFHHVPDASKVALVHLLMQLEAANFLLHDIQFSTPHLRRFGAIELPKSKYLQLLEKALSAVSPWWPVKKDRVMSGDQVNLPPEKNF